MKITWRVDPPPAGQWRSFEMRSWPSASFPSGKPAAMIYSDTEYSALVVKNRNYSPLLVNVFHHNHPLKGNSWKVFKLKVHPKTLAEAKLLVAEFYKTHPEWLPKGE